MEDVFRWIVGIIARLHHFLLKLNDASSASLTDKELHLVVMGATGMALYLVTFALFRAIERKFRHSTMIFSFIFAFTNLIVIAFAIEIGQRLTGTGSMEFLDIVYGLWGYLFLFSSYLVVFVLVQLIRRTFGASSRRR